MAGSHPCLLLAVQLNIFYTSCENKEPYVDHTDILPNFNLHCPGSNFVFRNENSFFIQLLPALSSSVKKCSDIMPITEKHLGHFGDMLVQRSMCNAPTNPCHHERCSHTERCKMCCQAARPHTHTQFFKMTYGQGMVIRTSSSCMSVCSSSYSMLTSQPLLLSDGQQLTVKHTYNDISAPPVCLSFLMPLTPPSLFKLFSTF